MKYQIILTWRTYGNGRLAHRVGQEVYEVTANSANEAIKELMSEHPGIVESCDTLRIDPIPAHQPTQEE